MILINLLLLTIAFLVFLFAEAVCIYAAVYWLVHHGYVDFGLDVAGALVVAFLFYENVIKEWRSR